MTKEEKIIATAFTGIMFIDGSDMGSLYEYMEKKVGHGVIDLTLASKEFWVELHKACEQDFIDMISKEQPSLPNNLDEAAIKYADTHGFRVPYDGSNNFYNDVDVRASKDGFKAGVEWAFNQMKEE